MSASIRRERRSPAPKPHSNSDLTAQGPAARPSRADWLLLLPMVPGAVALDLGCGRGSLSLDLAQFCDRVVAADIDPRGVSATRRRAAGLSNVQVMHTDAIELAAAGRRFDVVVVEDARRLFPRMRASQAVALLSRLLTPGGCIALAFGGTAQGGPAGIEGEWPVPKGSPLPLWGDYGAGNLSRLLARAGLADVQLLAASPDAFTADCLFRVGGRAGAGAPGRVVNRGLWPAMGWRETLLRAAAQCSLWSAARVLAPAFWVLARAPGSLRAPAAEEMVRSIAARPPLADLRRTDLPERARTALRSRSLTFVASREHGGEDQCATLSALAAGWSEPACVLRVQRQRGGESRVGEEQANLARLRARLSGRMRESVPAPLGTAEVGDHHAAAEAYLEGISLHRAIFGRSERKARGTVEHALPAAAHWLAELHEQTCACMWVAGEGAEARIRRAWGPAHAITTAAEAGATALDAVINSIAGAGTRLGASHNRLEPGRVLLRASGIAVTGWDRVQFEDLPLLDLFALAIALGGLLSPARALAGADAFRFACEEGTWYHEEVKRTVAAYCTRLGIARDTAHLYLAFGLMRQAASDPPGGMAGAIDSLRLAEKALQTRW